MSCGRFESAVCKQVPKEGLFDPRLQRMKDPDHVVHSNGLLFTMSVSATGDASAASHDDAAAAREEERVYDTVLLSEMEYVEDDATYYYQCPCGDMFEITVEDLKNGITIARCPSCSLKVRVDTPLPSEGKRVGGAEGASSTT